MPALLVVYYFGRLQSSGDVTTLEGEVKPCALVLHKVERHLWKSLLLEVGDDGLPNKAGFTDHLEDVVVSLVDQGVLEHVFGWID